MTNVQVEDYLPGVHEAAERLSASGQAWFKRGTLAALALLVAASVFGLITAPWAGWLSALAFGGSVALTSLMVLRKAEDDWYDGRAVAESVKTLTWKYAVGGEPFEIGQDEPMSAFERALNGVVEELRSLRSAIEPPTESDNLGPLTEFRGAELGYRRAAYREQRLQGQRKWYSERGREHRRTARNCQATAIVLQSAGVAAGVLKGLEVVDLDLLSVFAAAAAAALAWLAAGDYRKTARAYGLTTFELDRVLNTADRIESEHDWARFVADAEQTMSREHTTWLARRRGP